MPRRRPFVWVAMLALSAFALFGANTTDAVDNTATPAPKPIAAAPAPHEPLVITPGQEQPLDLRSDPVTWRDQPYELLRFSTITFTLDPDTHQLQATIQGRTSTFDSVPYTLHAAVFDNNDQLLGTASVPCPTQRVWLGRMMTSQQELLLDFGVSNRYPDAHTARLSLTSHDVLTPDQWQDE